MWAPTYTSYTSTGPSYLSAASRGHLYVLPGVPQSQVIDTWKIWQTASPLGSTPRGARPGDGAVLVPTPKEQLRAAWSWLALPRSIRSFAT